MIKGAKITAKKPEAKRNNSASQGRKTESSQSINSPVDHILFLQRTIGNQTVQRLFKSGALQVKLKIGQSGDIYEQEADRVAGQVMRMPESPCSECKDEEEKHIQTKLISDQMTTVVQRQVEEEEEGPISPKFNLVQGQAGEVEEEIPVITKRLSEGTLEISNDLEESFSSTRGLGSPLPADTRAFMEERFGVDFSAVRIHAENEAAKITRSLNAEAFTYGRDIYFGAGRYSPGTSSFKRLLAHELTHVVQQKSRFSDSIIKSRQEFEPKSNETPMAAMNPKSPSVQLVTPPLIQRECRYFEAGSWTHPRTDRPGPAGTWCEELDEARARAVACPSDCFIYADGPRTHPYRPIPGPGPCAHYVAHELGITIGPWYANCLEGYSVSIGQITRGRDRLPLTDAQVNDIWTNSARIHSGVVERVDAETGRVRFSACSIGGHVYRHWTSDGYVWR